MIDEENDQENVKVKSNLINKLNTSFRSVKKSNRIRYGIMAISFCIAGIYIGMIGSNHFIVQMQNNSV